MIKTPPFLFLAGFLSIFSVALANESNTPPKVERIKAVLMAPTTTYHADATDADGDELEFAWEAAVSCGTFNGNAGSRQATWSHPNGDGPGFCPHDDGTSHKGTITLYVSDGSYTVICTYEGSESGIGGPCTGAGVSSNSPSEAGEWVILIALGAGYYFYRARGRRGKRICADEAAREAAARAKKENAEKDFNEIDRARKAAQDAQADADRARADADRARRAAGTRWSAHGSTDWDGEHREIHREGWHDKEKGKKADEAEARAKEVEAKAKQAKEDFDANGGENAWSKARDARNRANEEWRSAKEALDRCLEVASTPAPAPVPAPEPTPGGTTPPPQGPTGPVTGTPSGAEPTQTRRVCVDGERRAGTSTTETVSLLDLQSARLMHDRIYSDAGNEAMKFVDWLQDIKDTFMLGKKLKGGVEGYLSGSITGAADAAGLPDFLTWYDKAVDALARSMHRLAAIMRDKQQLGTYWIEYNVRRLNLACNRYDVCVNGAWQTRCELSVEDGGTQTLRTQPQEVHDIRELQPAIRRLFTQLRNRYRPEENKAKRFTQTCQ